MPLALQSPAVSSNSQLTEVKPAAQTAAAAVAAAAAAA
jgi:hypothetical protein